MNQNLLLIVSIIVVIFLLRNGLKTNNVLMTLVVAGMSLMCMKSRDPKNKANEICLLVSIYFGSVLLAKVMALNEPFDDARVIVDQETANEASDNLTVVTTTNTPAGTTQAPSGTTQAPAGTTQAPSGTTQAPSGTTQAPAGTTQAPGTTAPSETKSMDPKVQSAIYRGVMYANNIACNLRIENAITATRNLFK